MPRSDACHEQRSDPWLDPDDALEDGDCTGASAALAVDSVHQVPLASVRGAPDWWETSYLSNIPL